MFAISELTNGQAVTFRTGRAGETGPRWSPWNSGTLYVRRRESDLPAKYRKRCDYWRTGDIIGLTVNNIGWAEYTQGDYQGNGLFLAEDWYLEIKDLCSH